ncbi:MAG: DUF6259 domain-containing protein [Candidatus Helarchaeota archaeon]
MNNDSWFCVYHTYSTSYSSSKKAIKLFEKDVEFAEKLGIKYIIMEDYYKNLNWGEYSVFWNKENLEKMIKIIHDHNMKFIPYIDATELTILGDTYKKFGKKWSAKNKWGKIYSGFNSIFLPLAYPNPKFDFFTRLMCPKSGWHDYLLDQVNFLLNNLQIDGIYIDRIDYRVKCYDVNHENNAMHFQNGIPELINDIVNEVKSFDSNYVSIMNDSCMPPDEIMVRCIKSVDFVLSELLPLDWNPNSLYNKINIEWGDLAWKLRKLLRPIFQVFVEMQFHSESMTDINRIKKIVKRLSANINPDRILLFTHRKDIKGLKTIKQVVSQTGANICYFVGLKRLSVLKNDLL